MDYDTYRRKHFTDPAPVPRFGFGTGSGATLYFADYAAAVGYYTEVLGEPGYVEGDTTRGWQVGPVWLTLLSGGDGAPRNTEIGLMMETPAEAERLQGAFVAAGARGGRPSDQLMYEPVRSCPVTDPFGTELLIYARLPTSHPPHTLG